MPTWAKITLIVAGLGIVALFIFKRRASVAGSSVYTGTSYSNTITPAANGSSANPTADALNNALNNLPTALASAVRSSGKTVKSISPEGNPPVPVVTYNDGTTISGGTSTAASGGGANGFASALTKISLIPPAASSPKATVPPSTGPATESLKGYAHF